MSLALHYWMGDVHHCSGPPVSEMTYIVSSETLNHSIPYHTIPQAQVGVYKNCRVLDCVWLAVCCTNLSDICHVVVHTALTLTDGSTAWPIVSNLSPHTPKHTLPRRATNLRLGDIKASCASSHRLADRSSLPTYPSKLPGINNLCVFAGWRKDDLSAVLAPEWLINVTGCIINCN